MKKLTLIILLSIFSVGFASAGMKGTLEKFCKEFNKISAKDSSVPFTCYVIGDDVLVYQANKGSDFSKEILSHEIGVDRYNMVYNFFVQVFSNPANKPLIQKMAYEGCYLEMIIPIPGNIDTFWGCKIYCSSLYDDIKRR